MGRLHPPQIKALSLLGILIAAWVLVPPVVKRFLNTGFYEFQAPLVNAASHLKDIQSYWALRTSKETLIELGRDLARENAAYVLLAQQNQSLRAEIERLEALHNLPPDFEHRYEVARVIRRDINAWWQRILIRKGRNAGIVEGAAVIYRGGVAGRVIEVHANTALVELISSPKFRMAANIEGDLRPVVYQGLINPTLGQPIGEVRDVPPDIQASPGDPRRLVSSRLGGIFPQGIPIGTITRLESSADGLFNRAEVRLHPDLINLHEVAVLVPLRPEP